MMLGALFWMCRKAVGITQTYRLGQLECYAKSVLKTPFIEAAWSVNAWRTAWVTPICLVFHS